MHKITWTRICDATFSSLLRLTFPNIQMQRASLSSVPLRSALFPHVHLGASSMVAARMGPQARAWWRTPAHLASFMVARPADVRPFSTAGRKGDVHTPIVHEPHGVKAAAMDTSVDSSTSHAPHARSPADGIPQAVLAAELTARGVALPQFCPGCGIKLQMENVNAPGYFVIPNKLLEAKGLAEVPKRRQSRAAIEEEGGPDDDFQAALLGGKEDASHKHTGDGLPDVVCQRCFSLKHAGAIKDQALESELPAFDLGKKVGRKIFLQKDRRAVVVVVVDAWDFDGSLPRQALMSLYPPGYSVEAAWAEVRAAKDGQSPHARHSGRVPPHHSSHHDQGGGDGLYAQGGSEEGLGGFEGVSNAAAERGERGGASSSSSSSNAAGPKFKLMVAVNKADLLPKEATPGRLKQWVHARLRAAGLPPADKVFCVSAVKGSGVQNLVDDVRDALGFRGDLWVVGAQNAGKSSLISAMKRLSGTSGKGEPTIASMPGTTLGLINVPGMPLGPKHRAFDTPGVEHTHQLTALLTPAEVKQVLPSKRMAGRTCRVPAGTTLLIGGLARLDVLDHPGGTLYLTVFASAFVNLHIGKTEGAEQRVQRHGGVLLSPPASPERFAQLPAWTPRDVVVEGTEWTKSSTDIHIAGLGWVAVGVKGQARLRVWVAPSVQVTKRPALVPDYAKEFIRPGFSSPLPKAPTIGQPGKSETEMNSSSSGCDGRQEQ